jgi:hypothetical protein
MCSTYVAVQAAGGIHQSMKRRTKLGIQTNLDLTEESNTDWLPKCDDPAAI